jgi:PEP-CTERM motif-containing protein
MPIKSRSRVLSFGFAAVGLTVFGLAWAAQAAPIPTPVGLSPGQQYRLVFVTSTTRDATSIDIADYNAFVTAAANTQQALVDLGTTWTAIASTDAVDARDNTGTNPFVATGVPIYLLDGVSLVAIDNADVWDGVIANPIMITEAGAALATLVWTGTRLTGESGLGFPQGSPLGSVTNDVIRGLSSQFAPSWIDATGSPSAALSSLYGLSGVLIAPTVIPAPGTLVLFALGLAGLGLAQRRGPRYRRR